MDYSGKIIRKTPVTPSQTSASGVWSLDEAMQATKSNTWPVANVPNPISRSLRFRSSASAYLNRTPATASNRKTWTWSGWVKRSTIGANNILFAARTAVGGTYFVIYFNASNDLRIESNLETAYPLYKTNALFRDPSAWYHIVVALDMTQATSTERLKVYVNSVLQTTANYNVPAQNTDLAVNSTETHLIGQQASGSYYDGYMTEINFIDGQALTPSSFGGTNAVTGVWEPRQYTGTYGTNGFYLNFKDNASTAALGTDYSGNSNTWTTNNISLTAGSTYDSMLDVPTQWIGYNTGDVNGAIRGNYAVMNPLDQAGGLVFSEANLKVTAATGWDGSRATFSLPSTGKYYWETLCVSRSTGASVGILSTSAVITGDLGAAATGYVYNSGDGNKYNNGSNSAYGATWTTNDIIGISWDADTSTLAFFKNGVSQGTAYTGLSGTFSPAIGVNGSDSMVANFGQRPFSYTPPAGFLSLCTTNLPSPTILQGNQYFDATLYTGNSSTQSIVNSGSMQPDFVWLKARSAATFHVAFDVLRGTGVRLFPNDTEADNTSQLLTSLTSFNSNGFSLGSHATTNNSGVTYVGWQWDAGTSTVTNTAGSISSQVRANPTAGFSIVTWTGNGTTTGQTVGHGLGVTPAMIIVKCRSESSGWQVWHKSLSSATTSRLTLETTNATDTSPYVWGSTAPTSTSFGVGWESGLVWTNKSSATYVAYCFAAVPGYSAFGSYTGNGSTDGTFVYTGFRPRFVMVKRTSSGGYWSMKDTARDPYNVADKVLWANASDAESSPDQLFDLDSNGFKLRGSNNDINASGATYIYMAFAENPFKNALAR